MSRVINLSAMSSSAQFALAAAHGITDKVIATWNPLLPRTPRVLVPVQLDALIVRQVGGTFADCKMSEPPQDGTPMNRRDLLPAPFTDLAESRPRGAYLHWALPDALTHGTQTGDTATWPASPNRWLVLRFHPSVRGLARRGVRGWVLKANEQTPVVVPLDQWAETGSSPDALANPLTALGHGDVAWAAYYDNVVNRLGFYDDLSDVKAGPIAYLVCGWYSDSTLDPLGDPNIKSLADFDARMAALRWELKSGELNEAVKHSRNYIKAATLAGLGTREAILMTNVRASPTSSAGVVSNVSVGSAPSLLDQDGHPVDGAYTTDGSWWPRLTLYHGSVVGIGWPGLGWPGNEEGLLSGEAGGPPDASEVHVAIGATMTEALGVLVAQANHAPDEARVLEGFMLGSLADLDRPDGRARLDVLLHASTFGSIDGGSITERIWFPPTPPASPTLPPGPVQPKPGIFPRVGSKLVGTSTIGARDIAVTQAHAQKFAVDDQIRVVQLVQGRLNDAIFKLNAPPGPPPTPGHYEDVRRSLPRLFYPSDPVILIQGGQRSFKHGGDGRFTQDGRLECRLTGFCITELSCNAITGKANRVAVNGDDLLERGTENGSVPPECEDLLRETALLDPGSSVVAAQIASSRAQGTIARSMAASITQDMIAQARNFTVEQTAWWAIRDPRVDQGPLVALSGLAGMLPSPVAVTPPARPWNPIHLDWKVQFIPSTNGVQDWSLDEIDFEPDTAKLPAPDDMQSGIILQGRAHLTGGATQTIAAAVRQALAQASSAGGTGPLPPNLVSRFHSAYAKAVLDYMDTLTIRAAQAQADNVVGEGDQIPSVDRSLLADIASALESMDVLAGAFDNFHTRLRGNYVGDGTSVPAPDAPDPNPFFPLRAGFLRILRLRLVDGYGQALDLAGSSDTANVAPQQLLSSQPMSIPSRPDLQLLPPRFTSPARLWLRYMDAQGGEQEASADITPVCGYLLPNHLDGDLEFFGVDGANLGVIRPDPNAGVMWEDAPGQPSTVGQSPARAIPNQTLASIAQGLLDWSVADVDPSEKRETALAALLRIIDSTLWSVDPFGHTGDEHLSLLIGHPIAVLRARVRLELREPIHPELVNQTAVPLRLGAITHWQDGLLGYFVNEDYRTLYCADASVAGFARPIGPNQGFLQQANLVQNYYETFADDLGAGAMEGNTPVTHPYVDDSGLVTIRPNQQLTLTLLVEPHTAVHATTGLLPRKEIGMRREWIAAALAKISPTFRFGPVLVDPKHIHMPVPNERSGTWSWDHRQNISEWAKDTVTNSTGDAALSPDPAQGTEGWLRLVPPGPSDKGSASS